MALCDMLLKFYHSLLSTPATFPLAHFVSYMSAAGKSAMLMTLMQSMTSWTSLLFKGRE